MTTAVANFMDTSVPQLVKVVRSRLSLGRGYRDHGLERKRQNAIHFLRYHSKRGWILDGGPVTVAPVQSVHADR